MRVPIIRPTGPIPIELVFLGPVDKQGLPLDEGVVPNTLLFSIVKVHDRRPYENFCNIRLKRELGDLGALISIGSACNTKAAEPSHVLTEMKAPFTIRCGVIRISLGDYNTIDECKQLCDLLINRIDSQR